MSAMETIVREIKRPPRTQTMPIGKLAELTSCNVPTIRYYEEIGLLPVAQRSPSGHRVYAESSIELLTFIRNCRDFGFTLDNIRDLISISKSKDQGCVSLQELAVEHLGSIRTKISELQALEARLANIIDSCSDICCGGPAPKCSILKDIVTPQESGKGRGCCG